ncbi:MAG: glycerophosphodiester phosphodiesterase [Bacillati bacterium ANGP1]|uniref:Glycerophosphodiester phosphodiesterase n=1 Tax=Candidatus Segetimicrobium genomatis TaxID=2569760 RepID=A0A537JYG9_9BACT|nr:MAG: glycerophosphodiester phosphodiesterase [Terrabacteria group bacterium ANGP1]
MSTDRPGHSSIQNASRFLGRGQPGKTGGTSWPAPQARRPLGVAHRGASKEAPENTLAAFRLALRLGAEAVECDARRTRDGQVVVIHDGEVDRTTDGRGPVESHTLSEIRGLDAGRWFGAEFAGERIPLLTEVLEAARGKALVKLEIKNDPVPYEGIERQIVDIVRGLGMEDEVFVMSFDHECVRAVRALAPRLATGILYAGRLVDAPHAAQAAGADALCVHRGYVSPRDVDRAHAAGLAFFVWTVDDEDTLRRCAAWGVDGVTSNDTRLMLRVLGKARSGT